MLTNAYVNIFRTVTRNAVNKSVWRKKDCFWLPLNKHTMNIFIQISNSPRTRARFSENQSAPRLENRKTSPCSPCAPHLLHVLVSRILRYHNLCSPGMVISYYQVHWEVSWLYRVEKEACVLQTCISQAFGCLTQQTDGHTEFGACNLILSKSCMRSQSRTFLKFKAWNHLFHMLI